MLSISKYYLFIGSHSEGNIMNCTAPAEQAKTMSIKEELDAILARIQKNSEEKIREKVEVQVSAAQAIALPATKKHVPAQESLFKWVGFPTDMTRVSPFFPMNVKDLKDRPFMKNLVITAAGWGKITYTGPKLSTYDEDTLLVLLACLESTSKHRSETMFKDGRKTYTYKGPVLPLLQALGYNSPGKEAYARFIESLRLLAGAVVELSISSGQRGNEKKDPRFTSMSAILANATWDNESKVLSVTINPFFYEAYLSGTVTLMDVAKRMSLPGGIARSLYRFVQSHRDRQVFSGHFLTLAQVLNMDTAQPRRKVRELLKKAISELVKQGVLLEKSCFVTRDVVVLHRSNNALPSRLPDKSVN